MKRVVEELYLNGSTPQQVIRRMTDIINRTKQLDKANLRIEEYMDYHDNPFEQNPDKCWRVVVIEGGR